jgi:hypothetical protein
MLLAKCCLNLTKGVLSREVTGSPIDGALLRIVEALEGNSGTFRNMHPKVCEIPFSPIIKFHLVSKYGVYQRFCLIIS